MTLNLRTAKPDTILAEIRTAIREGFGNDVENKTELYATHGWYVVKFPPGVFNERVGWRCSFRRLQTNAVLKFLRKGEKFSAEEK